MTDKHLDPAVRHEFVLLFDVTDGNPNGDPDAANQPRLDPETGHGLVTDVAIKRKIRNYVATARDDATHKIFIEAGVPLNAQMQRAYTELGLNKGTKAAKDKKKETEDNRKLAQAWMCRNFFDVRLFGAVMSTGDNDAGKVQGPVQLAFARSIDPIVPTEHAITRVTPTREGDTKETEMGSKWTVPYGLYRMHGFVSAHLAERTGVSSDDLALFYEALGAMFDLDRSAARGEMATRALHVFSHSSKLGNAPAHLLLGRIGVRRKDPSVPARSFDAYELTVPDPQELPEGVTHTQLV
jgi:CRISPR-associated protein Csd2